MVSELGGIFGERIQIRIRLLKLPRIQTVSLGGSFGLTMECHLRINKKAAVRRLFYTIHARLDMSVCNHSIGHFYEAGYIRTLKIVGVFTASVAVLNA